MRILATMSGFALLLAMHGCGEPSDRPSDQPSDQPLDQPSAPQDGTVGDRTEPAPQPTPGVDAPEGDALRVDTIVIGAQGTEIGTLAVEPLQQGVRLALHVEGLSPGPHAVHFHQHGRCDPPEFESAGDHFNPTRAQHGMPDLDEDAKEGDHHAGDMLNQEVDDQRVMDVVMVNDTATLSSGPNKLLDEDGSALIIHADPDDYESQPSGNAGGRVACAVIASSEVSAGP